ncbi:MAG: hypothetical protein B6D38_05960 [Anaerolineae bacterium UTCFX1]|jgi:hypothetical protein|nr:MAG: hypothetical protein B6D38_05960 [Anaerolineae bacterium UTCFX1]
MENLSLIADFATAFGVFVAMATLYVQTRQNSRALGATLLRDFERQFESEEMLRVRLETAKFLINRKTEDAAVSYCADLLDFFDVLGAYHNRNSLDTEMTWVLFYYWFGNYWYLLKNDASQYEQLAGGVSFYQDAERLYKTLTRFSKKKRRLPDTEEQYFTAERLNNFLQEEIAQCSGRLRVLENSVVEN